MPRRRGGKLLSRLFYTTSTNYSAVLGYKIWCSSLCDKIRRASRLEHRIPKRGSLGKKNCIRAECRQKKKWGVCICILDIYTSTLLSLSNSTRCIVRISPTAGGARFLPSRPCTTPCRLRRKLSLQSLFLLPVSKANSSCDRETSIYAQK